MAHLKLRYIWPLDQRILQVEIPRIFFGRKAILFVLKQVSMLICSSTNVQKEHFKECTALEIVNDWGRNGSQGKNVPRTNSVVEHHLIAHLLTMALNFDHFCLLL